MKKKVNIAGGPVDAKGWTNVEYGVLPYFKINFNFLLKLFFKIFKFKELNYLKNLRYPKNTILHNVLKNLDCFKDESIDFFYCSHFVEHLTKDEFSKLIRNIEKKIKKKFIKNSDPRFDSYY